MQTSMGLPYKTNDDGTSFSFEHKADLAEFNPGQYRFFLDGLGKLHGHKIFTKAEGIFNIPNEIDSILSNELQTFIDKKHLYKKYNLAYKRAILLYGPPGCGKSSLLTTSIQKFIANGCYVTDLNSLDAYEWIHDSLTNKPVIIVQEDIDSVLEKDEEDILNLLDSGTALTNVFYLFTTNFIEKLPDRFVNRPGRVDLKIKVDYPSVSSKLAYLKYVFPNEDINILDKIANETKDKSYAIVKEIAIRYFVFGKPLNEIIEEFVDISAN